MILSDLMTELKYTGFIENPEISARIFQDLFTDLIDSTKMLLDMLKVAQISFRIFTLTLMWRIFQDCFKYFLILEGLSGSLFIFRKSLVALIRDFGEHSQRISKDVFLISKIFSGS